jgi:hypothetical protein
LKKSQEGKGARAGEVNCPPVLAEVVRHGSTLIPACPEAVCHDFFDYWEGRGWRLSEKAAMADFRPILERHWRWVQKEAQTGRKTAVGKSGAGAAIEARTRKASLEALIASHPANPESAGYNADCTAADRKNLTALRREAEAVTRQLAGKEAA